MPESMPDFDLYAVLGVSPDADAEAIRAAHREAVRAVHPDVAGDDDEQAKRLNVARDWLLDPGRRARYDAARDAATGGPQFGPLGDGAASTVGEAGLDKPGRREALGCLELAWWLLLLAFAALIFAVLLLIAADL